MPETNRYTFRFDDTLIQAIDRMGKKLSLSRTDVIRLAVRRLESDDEIREKEIRKSARNKIKSS